MKDHLLKLARGGTLSRTEARAAFDVLMEPNADAAQVGALLALLAAREPAVDELIGVAEAMRARAVPIAVPPEMQDALIDTCGTGGVGSSIFNVSTAAAIVAAACGVPVAKHGNRGFTSRSGSSDVLRLLGVNVDAAPEVQARCLVEANICFAFAPRHHPATRHVAAVRQALGFSTIFNLAGPLANPAGARRQLVGVGSVALTGKILAVLMALGVRRAMVVHGRADEPPTGSPLPAHAGLCELSISGVTTIAQFDGTRAETRELRPQDVGLRVYPLHTLEIGSAQESADRIQSVLRGEFGPARDIVLLNSAAALWVAGKVEDLSAGFALAAKAVDSGRAQTTLKMLARISTA